MYFKVFTEKSAVIFLNLQFVFFQNNFLSVYTILTIIYHGHFFLLVFSICCSVCFLNLWVCSFLLLSCWRYSLCHRLGILLRLRLYFTALYAFMMSHLSAMLICSFFWKVSCNPHLHALDPLLYLCPDTLSSSWFTPLGRLSFELFIWVIGFLTFVLISGWVLFSVSTCLLNSSLKS